MEKARADPKRGNKGGIDTRMMMHICKPKGEHLQPPSTGNENNGMLQPPGGKTRMRRIGTR